jgi:hypothetical protein
MTSCSSGLWAVVRGSGVRRRFAKVNRPTAAHRDFTAVFPIDVARAPSHDFTTTAGVVVPGAFDMP